MKVLLVIAVVLILIVGGGFVGHSIWNHRLIQDQQDAEHGVLTAVASLPRLPGFEIVPVKTMAFSNTDHSIDCHYGQSSVLVGTSAQDALNIYVTQLQHIGWKLRELQYTNNKVLLRGTQERLNIFTSRPGLRAEDYSIIHANQTKICNSDGAPYTVHST